MEAAMAGVVLCGGASRRMGTDKASLVRDGRSWLAHAADRLVEAGAGPVLVATGAAGRIGPLPWDEVDDGDFRGCGPLAGIAAALAASPHDRVAVLAVDLVEAEPELLRWLASIMSPNDRAIIPLDSTGRAQPLHAIYATSMHRPIADALVAGERRVLRVVEAAGGRLVEVPDHLANRAWSSNHNEPGS